VPTGLTNIHDLNDDLLELVLLRIPCRVTLARAAATCRPWRRLISGAAFIRRFRSLHPPLVLGHYYSGKRTSFIPAEPSPLGPAGDTASAFVDRVISGREPRPRLPVGEFRKTRHPRNVKFDKVIEICFSGTWNS
jgi:hypothetical protein